MDTFVTLTDSSGFIVILQLFEVPTEINFGGEQMLKVHQLVGGARIVDAMGRNDADITWEGMFTGPDALIRARYFDGKRTSGEVLTFNYFGFRYKVIIKSFNARVQLFYRIPYSITLQVVEDLTLPIPFIIPTNFDDLLTGAMIKANDLGNVITSSSISGALAVLNAAMNLVPSFNNASTTQVASVLTPLSAAQSAVTNVMNNLSGKLFS